uniref:Uncharacterized protein n=1 Tax=Cacopsylla melanoneura TaxID=428564 RepID=A0A8D8SNW6_9HEMI
MPRLQLIRMPCCSIRCNCKATTARCPCWCNNRPQLAAPPVAYNLYYARRPLSNKNKTSNMHSNRSCGSLAVAHCSCNKSRPPRGPRLLRSPLRPHSSRPNSTHSLLRRRRKLNRRRQRRRETMNRVHDSTSPT